MGTVELIWQYRETFGNYGTKLGARGTYLVAQDNFWQLRH